MGLAALCMENVNALQQLRKNENAVETTLRRRIKRCDSCDGAIQDRCKLTLASDSEYAITYLFTRCRNCDGVSSIEVMADRK